MSSLPAPLVPAEVDLRDFGFMPLDVRTLLTSSLWIKARRDPRVAHAAMSLWCECWHQVPCASLPDDDEILAELARCDDAEWLRVRERALHGFVKCSDGRLYHRHVAVKAVESWEAKQAQRARTKAATEARRSQHRNRDGQRDDERNDNRSVHQGTGTGTEIGTKEKEIPRAVTGGPGGEATEKPPATATTDPKPAPEPKGKRLDPGWVLTKRLAEWALAEFPHWTPEIVRKTADEFKDHWTAVAGSKGVKRDWDATWRTWCRSDIQQRKYPPPRGINGSHPPHPQSFRERDEAAEARRIGLATGGILGTPPPLQADDEGGMIDG